MPPLLVFKVLQIYRGQGSLHAAAPVVGPVEREKSSVMKQCARLQHRCDYNPRLSFRDDTPRIIERMQEVSIDGSVVWDPRSREEDSPIRPHGDNLPPFDTLTSDEEREKKAEFQNPGTYLVVVNPDSFSSLPEYSDSESPPKPWVRRQSLTRSNFGGSGDSDSEGYKDISQDPNIVILPKFEDCVRRSATHGGFKASKGSASPLSPQLTTKIKAEIPEADYDFSEPTSPLEVARRGGADARLLDHYRRVISPQLAQFLPSDSIKVEDTNRGDAFETQADSYPPLYHAMMALSAVSLAQREGSQSIDALQHYQETLPSLQAILKSASDMYSDGALFTHFFLLLYEIAAAERQSTNLWSPHLDHLNNIFLKRRAAGEFFSYDRIQWFVSVIDTYALLSGSEGGGGLTTQMIRESVASHPSSDSLSSLQESEDGDATFQLVLRLHRSVLLLALKLGHLATELRAESYNSAAMLSPGHIDIMNRQRRVHEIQVALRQVWATEVPNFIPAGWLNHPPSLPARVMAVFEHAFALHRACIIYSHTSMWSGQRAETLPDMGDEVGCCVSELLQLANAAVESPRLELRFIAFPLFMAGFASSSASQKMLVLELMTVLERDSIGRNNRSIRELLQAVYDRQKEMLMSVGHSLMVDWLDIKREMGLHIVNFGL
ncbi:MAG: hypothetical protein M1814_004563 [Vezdaea aestivalis]|nr:MAG: hypothetical protein M1814_004563 [Vezdaea aestivalis]